MHRGHRDQERTLDQLGNVRLSTFTTELRLVLLDRHRRHPNSCELGSCPDLLPGSGHHYRMASAER